MKGKKTILATAAAGCLAVTLYATQSRASEWCNVFSWWGDVVDHTCYFNSGNVRVKAQGAGTSSKWIWVNLVDALPRPPGIRYGQGWGIDSGGNDIWGCYTFDIDPSEGASGYDTSGCENATGISVDIGYNDSSVFRDGERVGDARDVSPKAFHEAMQKAGSQSVK